MYCLVTSRNNIEERYGTVRNAFAMKKIITLFHMQADNIASRVLAMLAWHYQRLFLAIYKYTYPNSEISSSKQIITNAIAVNNTLQERKNAELE
jgi:hypothetical protein